MAGDDALDDDYRRVEEGERELNLNSTAAESDLPQQRSGRNEVFGSCARENSVVAEGEKGTDQHHHHPFQAAVKERDGRGEVGGGVRPSACTQREEMCVHVLLEVGGGFRGLDELGRRRREHARSGKGLWGGSRRSWAAVPLGTPF